jgi:hypothetical protein
MPSSSPVRSDAPMPSAARTTRSSRPNLYPTSALTMITHTPRVCRSSKNRIDAFTVSGDGVSTDVVRNGRAIADVSAGILGFASRPCANPASRSSSNSCGDVQRRRKAR